MVVIFGHSNMNDDNKKDKKSGGLMRRIFGGSAWSLSSTVSHTQTTLSNVIPPHERRSLHCSISNASSLDAEVLSKDYIEKEVKYIGTITDIHKNFDSNNRTKLLSLLDEKKKLGMLTFQFTWQDDVIISFSVYNLKVMWRDGESLIHRIPLHQIAGAGYVCDNNSLYFFVKFVSTVNQNNCNLALFQCENKSCAEEMCGIIRQFFQLAYTNSTMDFFDKSILDGANTHSKFNSYSTDDSSEKRETITLHQKLSKNKLSDQSIDNDSLNNSSGNKIATYGSSTLPSVYRQRPISRHGANGEPGSFMSSSTRSSSSTRIARRSESSSGSMSASNSTHLNLQLHEYIQVLRQRLTSDELRRFAEQLHYFRTGTVPINVFLQQLLDIYTEQRKVLFIGMRHFIPDLKDRMYFENFLQQYGIDLISENVKSKQNFTENNGVSGEILTNDVVTFDELQSDSCEINSKPITPQKKLDPLDVDMDCLLAKQASFSEKSFSNPDIASSTSESTSRFKFLRIPRKHRKKGKPPPMMEVRALNDVAITFTLTTDSKENNFLSREKKKFFGFKNRKNKFALSRSLDDISATSPVDL